MDYWEHLAGVSKFVVENLADNNYSQILWVEYLKQISEQFQTLGA